jgi:flagellar motility protein MotE (MotC chaperone)
VRSVRLLPVVIFAALALLVFKGFGLLSEGSYVLSGPSAAVAKEAQARPQGEGEMSLPAEATLSDTSPTLEDKAPTIGEPAGGDHGAPAAAEAAPGGDHGAPSTASGEHAASAPAEGALPPEDAHGSDPEGAPPVVPDINCPALDAPLPTEGEAAGHAEAAPAHGGASSEEHADAVVADGCPIVENPTNEQGDALPTTKNGEGKIIPLAVAEGTDSETALLERLAERRDALDQREAELDIRLALVEAAEKRIEERTAELQSLEAQIQAQVDQRKAAEDEQFQAVVGMYESMKPKDAARIFDTLNMQVLLRVARSMSPRKLAPILAAMASAPAQALTTALASVQPEAVVADAGENLAALPQIQGQ